MEPIPDGATKRISIGDKHWDVPIVLPFTGNQYKYDWRIVKTIDFRPPLAGEFYLSGNPVEVWRAPNDLTQEFLIVKPGRKVVDRRFWVLAEEG